VQRLFQAISDENRRQVLKLLKRGSLTAGEIAERMPIGKAALSHHFAILKAADLVRCERRGQSRVYSLNTTALEDLAGWVMDFTEPVRGRSRSARKEKGS
jgi:ArsR family transcriptional regulator, arsenate/arsenite/antimonite-responsive transcriptional repressor